MILDGVTALVKDDMPIGGNKGYCMSDMSYNMVDAQVEELAWLIKDNLYSKHLVLSAEEMFVDLLSPLRKTEVLELQPMMSYERMLLHRLADVFGLAHQSVGQGENRHLVVERCENSLMPAVLVSDVLGGLYGDLPEPYITKQLLRRTYPISSETKTQQCSNSPALSLAERQTAYLAARKRIFSDGWMPANDCSNGEESNRPRNVPVVARRMIAHALGKTVLMDGGFGSDVTGRRCETSSSTGKKGERPKYSSSGVACTEGKMKDLNVSPAIAAKRLFAQALSLSVTSACLKGEASAVSEHGENLRGHSQGILTATSTCHIGNVDAKSMEITTAVAECANVIHAPKLDPFNDLTISSSEDLADDSLSSQTSSRTPRYDMPGRAARRILVQALGLPVPETLSANWERVQKHDRGHSSSPNYNAGQLNVLTS